MKEIKGHIIYKSLQEAQIDGKDVVSNWREAKKSDWVLTDEGEVVECRSKSKYIIRTSYGTLFYNKTTKLTRENSQDKYKAGGNGYITARQMAFVRLFCTFVDSVKSYQIAYGVTFDKAKIYHKRLINMEKIQ